jgi:lipopolysaccharide/colanic/teichoic acid biosynthesis glycosyltransferase
MLRRIIDILASGTLLLLAAPVMIATAIAIKMDGGPALYRQIRAGIVGRPFSILKFRSMRPNNLTTAEMAVVHGQVTRSHPDVTWIGRWIRRFKIDELPQLINVLRGEMSIVGPRPTVIEQVLEYSAYQGRRMEVLPGLTGWAQVNGGIEYEWPERILLDVWYVAHRTLWLDAEILCRTVMVVLLGDRCNRNALMKAEEYASCQLNGDAAHGSKRDKCAPAAPQHHSIDPHTN